MCARPSRAARLLPLLFGLAACQGSDSRSATETPAADSTTATPAVPAQAATPAGFSGYHRYVGTVGQAPVVLELTIKPPDTVTNTVELYCSYYYERQGAELRLEPAGAYQPGQPLTLREGAPRPDNPDETTPTGRWRAAQSAGPVLTGTWESADGRRQLPFRLREDYTDAVRYELLTGKLQGPPCPLVAEGASPRIPEVERTFLHLLGPDTLRPALRVLQAPVPEQRRNQLAVELDQADCAGSFGFYGGVNVALNGYGLLSVMLYEGSYSGGPYPSGTETFETYDLRTGRALKRADWLRPGREEALRRLLLRRLRASPYAQGVSRPDIEAAQLPDLGLDSEGAYCPLGSLVGVPHVIEGVPVVVPYRELRPLVQPGSAVARMLQRRGLW